ncbi:hypothetical protein [Fusobacterium sp. MFO224]|uniref:hypothetical protein n=1 Tax=Fusobacterium sp. MFO224 TaxID=3378070 RepID=UPI003851C0AF
MYKKYYLILALAIMGTQINAAEESQVELNLSDNSVYSKNGVDVKFENNKIKAFNLRRDTKQNKLIIKDKIIMDSYNLSGDLRVEGTSGEVSLDGKKAKFDKNFAWLEVGNVTGAEKPNDRIFFGSEKANYTDGKIELKKAWLTTDPKADKDKDNKDLGYYLESDSIFIEPDKQVTLRDTNLFVKNKDIMPFTLPWYRFNIRSGSEIPLFPEWRTTDDYGWTISQGILYESKDRKYKGGFAPKFADEMGLLVGRMENWYTFDNIGESRLNVNNALIWKKNKDGELNSLNREDESNDDRWDIDYTHKYRGEKGYFNFGVKSVTYNENSALKDAIEDLDAERKFNYIDKDGVAHNNQLLGNIPDMGSYSNFYNLSTELNKLGANKDISINAKLKLTDDEKAYHYMVSDEVDDMSYGTQMDHDLFSNLGIKKDNDKYTISGYYNYLKDVDPGSNKQDLQSRAEDFGFLFKDKENKITLNYDEKNGDEFRGLKAWERNPNLSTLKTTDKYNLDFDYTPWTVSKYEINDSRKFGAEFGEYQLTTGTSFKVGYNYDFSEKKLDLENDPLRKGVFSTDSRLSQYNRFENIVYNKKEENRAYTTFYTGIFDFTVAGGDSKETIETREGSNDIVKTYKNESKFYELGLAKNKVSLGNLGEVDIYGNIRQDQYKNSDDEVNRFSTGLTHRISLNDNLNNEFKISFIDYDFSGNEGDKVRRLINKNKEIKYNDKINFSLGNTDVQYKVAYTEKDKARDGNKDRRTLNNELNFLYNGKKAVITYYNIDKRYVNKNVEGENYNDLNLEDYGARFFAGNNEFYYKNENIEANEIDAKIWDGTLSEQTGKFNEDMSADTYGYTYNFADSKLNLEYTEAKDRGTFKNKDLLDINNKIYSVAYIKGKEIEYSYKVTYEDYKENYRKYDETDYNTQYNTDVISLNYSFKDKRVSDSDLREYASKEFGKKEDEITSSDLMKVKEIIDRRDGTSFDLGRSIDNRINYNGNLKQALSFNLSLERNKDRYDETSDYLDSLKEFKVGAFYSRNRTGFGYTYSEKSDYVSNDWITTEKEHELSFHTALGKPSEGWNLKTYIQFYDGIDSRESFLDEAGIRIGKEMGYYQWSIAYIRDYSITTHDYEWKTALEFTLLTFPDNTIFGIGGNGSSNKNVSPDLSLFNGIKIDE